MTEANFDRPTRELRVSVALCTHNGSAYVREQIRTILGQTCPPDELVVVDDDSRDDTVALIRQEVERHPRRLRIEILTNSPALGVTANFERAIRATHGELVALSDQDDVWHPQRLERMVESLDRNPYALLLFSNARLIDSGGRPTGERLFETIRLTADQRHRISMGQSFSVLMRRNVVTGATVMFRRELADRAYPFPQSWLHDEWLAIVAAATGNLVILDDPLTDYRQHGANHVGVSALDANGAIGRLTQRRADRNERLLRRAKALDDRISGFLPTPPESLIGDAAEKFAHELVRSNLPSRRVPRIAPVVREWRTERYKRFGNGLADVVRDLVQPT